jgi:hypothetical protein
MKELSDIIKEEEKQQFSAKLNILKNKLKKDI